MAVIYFNMSGGAVLGLRDENDLKLLRGDFDIIKADGRLKTVSDDDFNSYICGEKFASLDGDNVVLEAPLVHPGSGDDVLSCSSEDFTKEKNQLIENITKFLSRHTAKLNSAEFSSIKTRIEAYKTALENVDLSSVTFPQSVNFMRHYINNESVESFHKDLFV
jgi:hypothetical protein|tara:strand:- start:406 stop:894 length:489 start_codon:yes stop_codon:yes gene_type:complete